MAVERFLDTFFNVEVMRAYLPAIAEGMLVTLALASTVVVSGLTAGFLLAVARAFRVRPVNVLIVVFADVFRAVPPLVLIIFVYFALPSVGIRLSGFVATWASLSLVLAAFAEEIVWAGVIAVPRGQWDAARSTGLSFAATLAHVVLPQAVRVTIPPLTNRTIAVTKGTALASVVAVGEILYQAQSGYAFSYNPSPLTLGAIAYLVLFVPVVGAGRWIERRWS